MSSSQLAGSIVPRHISVLVGKAMTKISTQVGRRKRDFTAALLIAAPDSTNTDAVLGGGNLNRASSATRHGPLDSEDVWTDDDCDDELAPSNHWEDIDNDSLEGLGGVAGAEFTLRRQN